jgi:hypothetical protein
MLAMVRTAAKPKDWRWTLLSLLGVGSLCGVAGWLPAGWRLPMTDRWPWPLAGLGIGVVAGLVAFLGLRVVVWLAIRWFRPRMRPDRLS